MVGLSRLPYIVLQTPARTQGRTEMEEEEHEVYGGEIPVEEGDIDMSAADDDAIKVFSAPSLTII